MTIYTLFIIIGILGFFSLTALHDPLIHGGVAYTIGWNMTDYEKGILTGYTNVTMTQEQFDATPTWQVWTFFMAPALILLFGALIVILLHPHRIIAIITTILMFMNLPSLSPEFLLSSSDSSMAMAFLISRGWEPLYAMLLHWGIFFFAMAAILTAFYVMFENDPKDAEKRVKLLKDTLMGRQNGK